MIENINSSDIGISQIYEFPSLFKKIRGGGYIILHRI